MSKQLVDWKWYSNGKRVYYNLVYELNKVDGKTFEPLNHIWARDKNHVYVMNTLLRSADRETFRALNELYAKDANNVFYLSGKIKDADPETFEAFDAELTGSLGAYAKDKNHVYYQTYSIGKPLVSRGADPATFRRIGYGFGMDNDSVFFQGSKLRGADIRSWQLLRGGHFSRDHAHAYFNDYLIEDADPDSFEVLPMNYYARDKRHYYRYGERTSRDDFVAKLRKFFIFTGAVVEGVVIDKKKNPIAGLSVADTVRDQGILLKIECKSLLYSPTDSFEDPPVEGSELSIVQFFVPCDLSQWIGKSWIWRFSPLGVSKPDRLTVECNWHEFSPIEDLERIAALVDQHLRPASQT